MLGIYRASTIRASPSLPINARPSSATQSYSMLMFISPSLVSVMPWSPTRFMPPSAVPAAWISGPNRPGAALGVEVNTLPSLTTGECVTTGLLCPLIPGDTARRLNKLGSRSSSRRRLRRSSDAVGVWEGCGVGDRDRDLPRPRLCVRVVREVSEIEVLPPIRVATICGVKSIGVSSKDRLNALATDDDEDGGGGVR
jgi:hypothetical protein